MSSLPKKPTRLPLSITTSLNPVMPNPSFAQGTEARKSGKKRKSFAPFDKIRKFFPGGRAKTPCQLDNAGSPSGNKPPLGSPSGNKPPMGSPSGNKPPIIGTPTEETQKVIVDQNSTSNFAAGFKVTYKDERKGSMMPSLSLNPNLLSVQSQKTVSNDNLYPKEKIAEKMLRSTECLVTEKPNSGTSRDASRDDCENEEDASNDAFFHRMRLSGPVSNYDENHLKEESHDSPIDLDGVRRNQDNLKQSAAIHRQMMKPKDRRPPTVYQQRISLAVPPLLVNSNMPPSNQSFDANSRKSSAEMLETPRDDPTTETVENVEQNTDSKLSMLVHLKKKNKFAPNLEDLQKARRKTIANFQYEDIQSLETVTSNDKGGQEAKMTSELKVNQHLIPQRNRSFKYNRKEVDDVAAPTNSDSNKPDKNISKDCKISPLPPNDRSSLQVKEIPSKEKSLGNESSVLKKSRLFQEKFDIALKENLKISHIEKLTCSVTPKKEVGDKVTQSDIKPSTKLTPQTPFSLSPSSNVKTSETVGISEDLLAPGSKHCSDSETKPIEVKSEKDGKVGDSNVSNKFDKQVLLKEINEKSDVDNGHPENSGDPTNKKLPKPELEQLKSVAVTKRNGFGSPKGPADVPVVASNPGSPERPISADSIINLARRFDSKSFKIPPSKTVEEVPNDSKINFGSFKQNLKPLEEKPSNSNTSSEPTSQVTGSVSLFGNKKESKVTSALQVKEIPVEPFKIASKIGKDKLNALGSQNNLSKFRAGTHDKNVNASAEASTSDPHNPQTPQSSNGRPCSDHLATSNNPAANLKADDKQVPAVTKPETDKKLQFVRVAAGVTNKTQPNKLNFNTDNWMAERREKSEQL